MKFDRVRVLVASAAAIAIGICVETTVTADQNSNDPVSIAVNKGAKWLVSVQGKDGGWGQDGGETSYVRQGERLESNGNDVANKAVAAETLLHTGNTPVHGPNQEALRRAVQFIVDHVERSPAEVLAITDLNGTQIQRKLGPYIDTFLTSKLLAELDGNMGDARANERVRRGLEKCVAKIEKNQLKDGSWNIAGGWAPILGTSMASQSLFVAQAKGVAVPQAAMERVEVYTKLSAATPPPPAMADARAVVAPGTGGAGFAGGSAGLATRATTVPSGAREVSAVSAGISLYQRAQELEQLTRSEGDRKENAKQIADITGQLSDPRFVTGFGSVGGEEFFSYLNISDALHRAGGPEWVRWNTDMKAKILKMQNEDGTWAGHHCITGRVAVTSAAILMLVADREPVALTSAAPKR